MYLRKFGKGRRAVVVPNAAWLEADLESLAKNHTMVFYDPRNRGRSEPFSATLETEIADLDSVIRYFELEQVVLLGWSYHGAVVAHYASRNPGKVSRVIQCGPLAPRRVPYQNQALATLQSRLDMPAITELMKSPPANPVDSCKAFNSILLRAYFGDPATSARSLATPCESENEWPAKLNVHMNALIASFGDWD
jgi:pimeloyl-ACP methyl ester carboxylesterase